MLNCIVIQGRLKADAELRHTQSGKPVATVTLAVSRNRKNQNGDYPTDWIDVVFWGNTAEHVSRWFHKGNQAIVRGRLESKDWEDKNGNKRRSWEVQAESIDFCGSRKDSGGYNSPQDVQCDDEWSELNDDEPPF